MGERLNRAPQWLLKTLKVLKIVGIISGATAGVVAPWIALYGDVKPDAVEAQNTAEASLEAMAPAVVELQTLVKDGMTWADETDEELRSIESNYTDLDRRLVRCETYMQLIGQRRNFPAAPPPVASSAPPFHGETSVMIDSLPEPVQQRQAPQYKVPTSIGKAKATAKKRRDNKCDPGDPLCGALE